MLARDHLPDRFNAAEWFVGRHVSSSEGRRVALVTDLGETTFEELDRLVRGFAAALERQPVHRGDRVAIVLPDGPLFSVSFWGSIAAGAVAVPLNPHLKPEKLQAILADCDPRLLVFDPAVVDGPSVVNAGCALWERGEAERRAAATPPAPGYADTHRERANALAMLQRVPEAITAFEDSVRLDPKMEDAHFNLGGLLLGRGDARRAAAAFTKAVELNGKSADNHYALGAALTQSGDRERGIAAYRKAIALDAQLAVAHWDLGIALLDEGQFTEALAALERGQKLGARPPGPPATTLQQARRFIELEAKLSTVLEGKLEPASADERLEYAVVCQRKRLYASAARLSAAAFTADPVKAPGAGRRYQAAVAAALAGAGQGQDADKLEAAERARWRKQAADWLRAELSQWAHLLDQSPQNHRKAIREALERCRRESAFAGIREPRELAKLPPSERTACIRLWADVQELLAKCF